MDVPEALTATPLFAGIDADEIASMLGCLGARRCHYDAGEYVYRMGQTVNCLGVVLHGSVRIENVDVWGNTSVMGQVGESDVFAEVYAVLPDEPLMIGVVAATPTEVLFLNAAKVLTTCTSACPFHSRLAVNLTSVMARKNMALSRRIFHVAPKSIRGKVLAYLSYEATRAGGNEFTIPFDRQQMADYLGVDRSALSAELSRMQVDGLLETHRSHFVLKGANPAAR